MKTGTESPADRLVTVPNALCLFRILAAPFLILLAMQEERIGVALLFLAMTGSDWLDGKIAVRFDQRSKIGPALDSGADLVMYIALLFSVIILDGRLLAAEWPWLAIAFFSYFVAGLACVAKFGRWPSHHTRMAKISWLVMLVAAVAFLSVGAVWPFRVALVGGTLANLQSLVITWLLPEYVTDVVSIAEARSLRSSSDSAREPKAHVTG